MQHIIYLLQNANKHLQHDILLVFIDMYTYFLK